MEFFKNTKFDFIGKRKIAYTVSIVLAVIGLVSIISKGGLNLSIDFVGGTLIQMKFEPMPGMEEIRKVLADNGLKGAQLQHFPKESEIIIRVKKGEQITEEVSPDTAAQASEETQSYGETRSLAAFSETAAASPRMGSVEKKFNDMFSAAFPGAKIGIIRAEMVGPSVGKKLLSQAVWALFWGMIGIMIYVGWRFEFKYSAPAVLALLHDVFIVTGLLTLFNMEIDMTIIAALLTIVGYSINDTIVVYDRIREKVKMYARDEIGKVMNVAINDTLGRTFITGLTTIIVLLCIFFFGGEVIHSFAFSLLLGVVIGTYSSIFVASPLVYEWDKRYRKAR